MAKEINLIDVLDSMTNTDVETFRFISGSSVYDLVSLKYPYWCVDTIKIEGKDYDVDSVALFDLDVLSGKVNSRRFAYRLKGIDGVKLAGMVSKYWFYLQLCEVNQYKTLVYTAKVDDLNDDHKMRLEVLERRIENAIAVCNAAAAGVIGIDECAKSIVRAYITAPVAAYGDAVKAAATDVMTAIDNLFVAKASGDAALLEKRRDDELRKAIADLKCRLFPVGGCVESVHHKCSAAMREKVYMCAYKRTKPGKSGLMRIEWSKSAVIVADIILQVVGVMQQQQIKADKEPVAAK